MWEQIFKIVHSLKTEAFTYIEKKNKQKIKSD